MIRHLLALSLLALAAPAAHAVPLVSDATVAEQKRLTDEFKLDNGIPVVYRHIDDSDIVHVEVSFAYGIIDLKNEDKPANTLLFNTMPQGAKGWPKERIFTFSEKYSSPVGCDEGLEFSQCEMTTLNDSWAQMLPMFTAIVKEPTLSNADLALSRAQKTAAIRQEIQNPEKNVNDVVNQIFYEPSHPFWQNAEDSLLYLPKITRAKVVAAHKAALNAARMKIVVVGSLPLAQMRKDLNKAFGKVKASAFKRPAIADPVFDGKKIVKIVDQKIPTAYIRLKLNAPGFKNEDSTATQLLYKILDEELGDEIRTKRSLSYAVYSFTLDYTIGVGVISASTSKPKETLEALDAVIARVKNHVYTDKELENYKVVYATQYFLGLEEHSSLAGGLSRYFNYDGNTDRFYQWPKDLGVVTAQKIHQLANQWLTNFRAAVIYDKDQVKEEWITSLINHHLAKPTPAPH